MTIAGPMRIFVVDDDIDTTESMRLLLKLHGHEVRVANQGSSAVEEAPVFKPDVMLVDLGMPLVDGMMVARQLRARAELTTTSFVAVTGYADAPHRQQALDAGFDECLIKPVPLEALLALLEKIQARVADSRRLVSRCEEVATEGRQRAGQTRDALAASTYDAAAAQLAEWLDGESPVTVRISASGKADLISLDDRTAAERLRAWLRERGCEVGPVYQPSPERACFFSHARQQLRTLLTSHPCFQVKEG